MTLSIIIVNYNVGYFLEQCLYSVLKATKNIDSEIYVVDNNSVDGSCLMITEKFPEINLITNNKNYGFAYANNQAIRLCKGEFILLLNPDTVVEENTFKNVIDFIVSHPDAGGLGVKMIDGKGNYLPESKRGLPTPMVAFYKIFGLAKLFPKSKIFGKYHLGYLSKDEIHEVDVLSGAFMLLRKEALDKIGILDEDFFMYAEDIDLSYRIIKGGYKNYYFPNTTIIHYKGESTKKESINYVMVFYNAMIIFANKHFSKKNAKILSILIKSAIYFRAFFAILSRFFNNIILPVIDGGLIFLGFYIIKPYWEDYKFPYGGSYPDEFLYFAVPAYILIWLGTIYYSGGYDKPVKISKVIKGLTIGTILILIFYALLSENFRFSRALIFIGALWAFISLISVRYLFNYFKIKNFIISSIRKKKVVIVGNTDEALRVSSLLNLTEIKPHIIGFVSPQKQLPSTNYIGNIEQLNEVVKINKIEEIIFCAKDISSRMIIKYMLKLSDNNIDYKIASPDSVSVIGSNSINSAGDLYTVNFNAISKEINKRNKRLLDVFVSIIFILTSPIFIFIVDNIKIFYKNCFNILFGVYSWVGYYSKSENNNVNLPKIKKGILTPLDVLKNKNIPAEEAERMNMIYAKDYKLINDILIIYKGIKNIGRKH